jgi:hypothetical protein
MNGLNGDNIFHQQIIDITYDFRYITIILKYLKFPYIYIYWSYWNISPYIYYIIYILEYITIYIYWNISPYILEYISLIFLKMVIAPPTSHRISEIPLVALAFLRGSCGAPGDEWSGVERSCDDGSIGQQRHHWAWA